MTKYYTDREGNRRDAQGNLVNFDFENLKVFRITYINQHGEWKGNFLGKSFDDVVQFLARRFGNIRLSTVDKRGIEIHAVTEQVQLEMADKHFGTILKLREQAEDIEKALAEGKLDLKKAVSFGTVTKGNLIKNIPKKPKTIMNTILNRRKP